MKTNTIPEEFMCPCCHADVRIKGLSEQADVHYTYDYVQKQFVVESFEHNENESIYCKECWEALNFDFEDGLVINSNITYKKERVRYGNIVIEEEYTLKVPVPIDEQGEV